MPPLWDLRFFYPVEIFLLPFEQSAELYIIYASKDYRVYNARYSGSLRHLFYQEATRPYLIYKNANTLITSCKRSLR